MRDTQMSYAAGAGVWLSISLSAANLSLRRASWVCGRRGCPTVQIFRTHRPGEDIHLAERVDHLYLSVGLPVIQIFGVNGASAKRFGGGQNRRVPVGDTVALRYLDGDSDQP